MKCMSKILAISCSYSEIRIEIKVMYVYMSTRKKINKGKAVSSSSQTEALS